MIAFSAPGQGSGGEGLTLPMRPIPVAEPSWWKDARVALPTATREQIQVRLENVDQEPDAVWLFKE